AAEKRLRLKTAVPCQPESEADARRLLHELQVHQVELEIQNEELLRTREELETTLARYSHLYDFAPVGYATLSRDAVIRSVNLTGAGMLGMVRSQLVGRSFLFFVSLSDHPAFRAFLDASFKEQGHAACEALLHTADKHPFHARIEADVCGCEDECLVALIDISESKEAEATLLEHRRQLEEAYASLERRVADAVAEVRSLDRALLTQNRQAAMGEMIGCIAHQWRQPLNVLGMNIQRLSLFYEKGHFDKEFLDTSVRDAMQVINHMSRTIDDFRNFFMPDKEVAAFEVNQSVVAAVALIQDSLQSHFITLERGTQGESLRITGYPREYSQALLNIIINAQDALVERRIAQPRITIASFRENDRVVVTIADNAGGIPEEIMERVFDPYFTTKELDKGTGIGLFMAKTIIEKNMNGRLTARNINGGAEFRIEV
ncbi:MAG TPA: ATP-binding protein, partial [Desulfuromonadaceae bacterium]